MSTFILSAQSDEDTLSVNSKIEVQNEMTKDPMTAVWRTFIFPGMGQIYVEKYWKAPIFAAGAGTLIYFIFDNHIKFSDFQSEMDLLSETDREYLIAKSKRDFYLDNRDRSILFLAGVYLLASIDAYVGANLYDFEVDDNISLYFSPSSTSIMNVGVLIKF